ncbi:PAS domain-containing protein [Brucella haematophila]|uniref:PAS domain-containing protein n=1 Tax=Brucella haematophila TaxID=419474 RepID=A0ABX1DK52_9HYPH|nr:PAS domain-containing protein [Brucella haematophila]NKC02666.1 PAS domain-containing protein [Brucella haematophila]TMU92029.1 PAS domain-containing protein [Brucella haematophila]
MKHRSTIAIFSEWQRLAFDRNDDLEHGFQAPQRTDVEPRRLGRHLSDLFFVEAGENGELVFRLGGTRICTLFGRELKGVRLLSLWPERDRPALSELAQNVSAMQIPALSLHDGISLSGRSLSFEMLLAPLEASNGRVGLMGSMAVLDNVTWAGADPLVLGHLNHIEPIAPDVALADEAVKAAIFTVNASNRTRQWTETRMATPPVRKAPHLRVINGGKA